MIKRGEDKSIRLKKISRFETFTSHDVYVFSLGY